MISAAKCRPVILVSINIRYVRGFLGGGAVKRWCSCVQRIQAKHLVMHCCYSMYHVTLGLCLHFTMGEILRGIEVGWEKVEHKSGNISVTRKNRNRGKLLWRLYRKTLSDGTISDHLCPHFPRLEGVQKSNGCYLRNG